MPLACGISLNTNTLLRPRAKGTSLLLLDVQQFIGRDAINRVRITWTIRAWARGIGSPKKLIKNNKRKKKVTNGGGCVIFFII